MNTPATASPSRTLAAPVRIAGVGLFTGADTAVRIEPAPAGRGLSFACAVGNVPASIEKLATKPVHEALGSQPRSTNLSRSSGRPDVPTTEHIMAALSALGVTDACVFLQGPEIPIGDGSAKIFTDPMIEAGFEDRDELESEPVEPFVLKRSITVRKAGGVIKAEPIDIDEPAVYRYELDYKGAHPMLEAQSAEWTLGDRDGFLEGIAPARTFSLSAEVEKLGKAGLFTRFTPEDLLVFGDDGPIDNELRFDNEPARHKLLDLIGDVALVGRPVHARITATQSGHALNHELVRRIIAQMD